MTGIFLYGLTVLGLPDEVGYLFFQCFGHVVGLAVFYLFLIHQPQRDNPIPDVFLHPSLPGKPFGYYRKHRHVRQYHLRRRITGRPIQRPVRDPPRRLLNPLTWCWSRRIPIPLSPSGISRPPCHRKRKRKRVLSRPSSSFARLTTTEIEQDHQAEFDRLKHKLLHQSWAMFDLQFGVCLDAFVSTLDPLGQFSTLQALSSPDFLQASAPCSALRCVAAKPFGGVAMLSAWQPTPSTPLSPTLQRVTTEMLSGLHSEMYRASTDDMPIVLDTGASTSITPVLSDFIGPLEPTPISEITGLNSKTRIVGKGTVEWAICDYWNVVRVVRTTAYYVPDIDIRLFSPQAFFQENGDKGRCVVRGRTITLELPDGSHLEFPYNQSSNLPFMFQGGATVAGAQYCDAAFLSDSSSFQSLMSVTDQTNQNLRPSQKELLLLHQKLGHAGFQWCQRLCQVPHDSSRSQVFSFKTPHVSTCDPPLCTACQLAKQHRRTPESRATSRPEPMKIRQGDLNPGDCVSLDQYISALPGRLPHTKGKEPKSERYNGGTIFVDHSSSLMFLQHQVSLTAGETLRAKKKFEQQAAQFGVSIKNYRADNVPFGSAAFLQNIKDNGQTIDFSGTGAHHQNGVAERAIQTVTSWARAMLLHAVIMWPDQADLTLWPFAMEHAVYLWNNLPKIDNRTAPLELFSRTKFPSYDHLHRLHVWGCPVFVLDPKLQDGKSLPKWSPRSRRGQFLGVSPDHSSTIGRILNLVTGYISPQYHVVYDDQFTTVPNAASGGIFQNQPFDAASWDTLVSSGLEYVYNPDSAEPPQLHDDWLTPDERLHRNRQRENRPQRQVARDRQVAVPEGAAPPVAVPEGAAVQPHGPALPEGAQPIHEAVPVNDDGDFALQDDTPDAVAGQPNPPAPNLTTRSGRRVKRPDRLIENMFAAHGFDSEPNAYRNPKRKVRAAHLNHQFLMALQWTQVVESLRSADLRAMLNLIDQNTDPDSNTVEWMHPMILAAKANAADNPTWDQAMNGPDQAGYWEACKKELQTLTESKDAWDVVDRQDWMNVLPSTWAFKCKRYPDGSVRKLKARFCARGDKQIEGVDYFDTFAPVVNWTTIRLLLILSIILGLSTRQVDYTAAFVHAPIDKDPEWDNMTEEQRQRSGVYIEMPRGFSQPGKVLKLKRSLYGLKQSPRNFFQHLKSKLEGIGFQSNESVDPCLFISDKVICLIYVDDTLLFSPKEEYIDEVISKLSKSDLELEVEDSVAGFLGVHLEHNHANGSIKLTQQGLARRVVEALNLGNQPRKLTPASSEPLVKDDNGEPPNGSYSYASVIGMLQYLQGHSRPDITYAVSQCARFVHSPKRSHEVALERIGLYLKGTLDEGLILKPTGELDIDVYVDADFAGLWPYEDKQDPSCVKSRTGFVICISGCPIVWVSKLQNEIALSTMEAEYNALSYAMRSVLPFKTTVLSVAKSIGLSEDRTTTFKTTVWEDNAGALTLANLEPGRITPRSKHYAIKYHWFRSHLKPSQVEVKKIDTHDQKADILTKGLTTATFRSIRKLLCGW